MASWQGGARRRRKRLRNVWGGEQSFSDDEVSEPWGLRRRRHRAKIAKQRSATTTAAATTIPTIAPVGSPFLLDDVGGGLSVLSEGRVIETILVLPIGSAICTAWWTEKVLRS